MKPLSERMKKSLESVEKGLKEEPSNMAIPWIAGRLDAWIPQVEALESANQRLDKLNLEYMKQAANLAKEIFDLKKEVARLTKRCNRQEGLLNPTLETRVDIHGLEEEVSQYRQRAEEAEARVADVKKIATELLSWHGALCNSAKVGHKLRGGSGRGGEATMSYEKFRCMFPSEDNNAEEEYAVCLYPKCWIGDCPFKQTMDKMPDHSRFTTLAEKWRKTWWCPTSRDEGKKECADELDALVKELEEGRFK